MNTTAPAPHPVLTGQLTLDEMVRLTNWKRASMLETMGFTKPEARALVFLDWRIVTGRLNPAGRE